MTPDFMPPPASAPMDPQALPPGLQTIPQVDGQGAQDAAALQNALKVEGATGEGTGTGFFDKLRTDPKLSQAMLVMGSALMQGPKPGQDQFGLFGNAMMAGALTHNMLTLNEGVDQRATQESAARVAESGQRVKAGVQKMEQDAALHPVLMEKYNAEIVRAKQAGELDRVKALKEAFLNDPKNLEKMLNADLDVKKAQAASGYGSANANNARAEQLRDETKDPSKYHKARGGTGGSAQVQTLDTLTRYYADIYPNETPAEHKQRALDYQATAKGKERQAEFLDFVTKQGYDLANPKEMERATKAFEAVEKQFGAQNAKSLPKGAGTPDDAWTKARNSVQPGQDYTGPDGVTYKRPK